MKELCKRGHLRTKDNLYRNGACKLCANFTRRNIKQNPKLNKEAKLKARYGLTLESRDSLILDQSNKCAICGIVFDTNVPRLKPRVDHCHITNRVRGILCHHCNAGIGHFFDNISYLENAIKYLSKERITTERITKCG